ncbi:hypothetical protein [Deinococcus sonorensis]|uniref:Uncharacterized protein n=2 Tax=Deinococcus sonorensis TaxID=309891 RepID=A0AAU7U9A2_9DEIO
MTPPVASALPRPIDLKVPSNRFVVVGSVLAGLGAALLGRSPAQAAGTAAAAFTGWATARELDPDQPGSASVALLLAALQGAAQPGSAAGLLGAGTVLSSLRVLAGTVGLPVSGPDAAALTVQAALCAGTGQRVAALVPGAALLLSSALDDAWSAPRWSGPVALAAGLLPAVRPAARERSLPLLDLAALALAGGLLRPEVPVSRCDHTDRQVSGERVRTARLLGLGTLALGLLTRQPGLGSLAAASSAVALRRSPR